MIIIILLIILIILYIIDMYNRESFKVLTMVKPNPNSLHYGNVNYNTPYENCKDNLGSPLNKQCVVKTVIPKRKSVCNNRLDVIDLNTEHNSLLSFDDKVDNELIKILDDVDYCDNDSKYQDQKNNKIKNLLMNDIDIKSLNSIDSYYNTLSDIDDEIKTLN